MRHEIGGSLLGALGLCVLVCRLWAKPPATGSILGKVTCRGQPLTGGIVTFINEKVGGGASSEIDSSGAYRITSIRTGEYNVAIHRQPPKPETPRQVAGAQKLNIPEKYQTPQTSGLTATVKEGQNTADFSL